jgi:Sulfotransferase family
MRAFTWITLMCVMSVAGQTGLLSSICRLRSLAAKQARDNGSAVTCAPLCGPLPSARPGSAPFLQRLAPACAAAMARYATPAATPVGAIPAAAPKIDCAASYDAFGASNPVVVHRTGIDPFIIATVPKAGCTNLRKLVITLIKLMPKRAPQRLRPGSNVTAVPRLHYLIHNARFPSIYHYELPPGDLRPQLPSFIIGRNPYERLVSGFLDKMTTHHDGYTNQARVCRALHCAHVCVRRDACDQNRAWRCMQKAIGLVSTAPGGLVTAAGCFH